MRDGDGAASEAAALTAPSPLMENGVVAFGFLLLVAMQWAIVARDLATRSAPDPLALAFPILWIDAALVVFTGFSLGILRSGSPASSSSQTRRVGASFIPDFALLRRAFKQDHFRRWALRGGLAYAVVVLILQGVVVLDPAGRVVPRGAPYPDFYTMAGIFGWAPAFFWVPNPFLAVTLRPNTVAGSALLVFLASVSFGLIGWRRQLPAGGPGARWGSGGKLAGLMAIGPACSAALGSSFLMGLLVPGAGTAGAPDDYGRLVTFSLALMIPSVLLTWIGIARMTRLDWSSTPPGTESPEGVAPRRLAAAWLLRLALAIALLAMILDLGAAPSGAGGNHGQLAAGGHPLSALVAAGAGMVAAAVGVALHPFPFASGRRLTAFKVGLIGLYADGVIHWFAVLEHLGSGPQVAFFLVSGATQIGAVWPGGRYPSIVWIVGVPLTVALMGLYLLTRLVPAPFELHAEPLEALGTASKAIEIVVLASLGAAFHHRRMIETLKVSVVHLGARALSRPR